MPAVDSKRVSAHGRDFIFVELAEDSSGRKVKTRLPGVHIGDGRYAFPYWDRVFPGAWTATFYIWATARRPLLSQPPGFNALTSVDYLFLLHEYVLGVKRPVLRATLRKRASASIAITVKRVVEGEDGGGPGSFHVDYRFSSSRQSLCRLPTKGQWMPLPAGADRCPKGVCDGSSLEPLLLGSKDSERIEFRDVYRPYDCRYRIFTRAEVAACMAGRRLALVGDSRTSELAEYVKRYFPDVYMKHTLIQPYRVGLRALMPAVAHGGEKQLRNMMTSFDVLVLSSEIHDIANYTNPGSMYAKYGFQLGDPRVAASYRAKEGLAPATHNCSPGDADAAERTKYRPVAQYLDALRDFASYFLQVREQLQHSGQLRLKRVLWFFTGYKPHPTPDCIPNQIERMTCLQHLELAEVGRAGWEPLDFATMLHDGPSDWMYNDAHVSGTKGMSRRRKSSGVSMMEVQALFNVLCNGEGNGSGR
ncbi:hypothetical protein GPECTOR_37g245 [Gonium pectorale]|uniref:Uncharacterized protein n=1 Tax=Gonium pectorale TaxID=33097 RepID=A0A150GBN0_GONPE|nr:hypothetical protein GPECTOR_37g245 [Gonium pectorale]|eukprot:KXZ47239.1 hypothetical protein GPECTOR_37g245 [Gonium pectorale]